MSTTTPLPITAPAVPDRPQPGWLADLIAKLLLNAVDDHDQDPRHLGRDTLLEMTGSLE